MDATVIINAFEQGATVDLVLHALEEQDFKGSWEIVVVDDGSTDETSGLVAKRAARADVPILYARLPRQGMRWCLARNIGMKLASGAVWLFLDGDMVPDRDVVRLHVLQQHEASCIAVGDRLWRNPHEDLAGHATVNSQLRELRTLAKSRDPAYRRRESTERKARSLHLKSKWPWLACFGCHVSIPAGANIVYDENMAGWGPADAEFACRLYYDCGLPVKFLAQARAWHVENAGACYNPFRTFDSMGATEYVRQVCYFVHKHSKRDLVGVLGQGFDRLYLDSNERWHVAQRRDRRDKRETFATALEWYDRVHRGRS